MVINVIEDLFQELQEAVAKLRRAIDQNEALQKPAEPKPAEPKPAEPKKPEPVKK